MLDATEETIKRAKRWFAENYGPNSYYSIKTKNHKSIYWIVTNEDAAMAFRLAFCDEQKESK